MPGCLWGIEEDFSKVFTRIPWLLPCIIFLYFKTETIQIGKLCPKVIKMTRRINRVGKLTGHDIKKNWCIFMDRLNKLNIYKDNISHYPKNDWCQIFSYTCCISRFLAGALRKHFCTFSVPVRRHCSSDCHLGCVWQAQWFTRKWNTFLIV